MKNITVFLAVLLFCVSTAGATLIDQGAVVYDDINDKYWQELGVLYGQTYSEQSVNARALTTDGLDWRLAHHTSTNLLLSTYTLSEIAIAFAPTSPGIWQGRISLEVGPIGTDHELKIMWNGSEYELSDSSISNSITTTGAWVESYIKPPPDDVSPTPIPPSVILLGTGLVGLAGFRRKLL